MSRNLARNSKFGLTNVHTEAFSSSEPLSTSSTELSVSPVSGWWSQSSASSASSLRSQWLPYVVRVVFLGCCLGYQITCFCLKEMNKITQTEWQQSTWQALSGSSCNTLRDARRTVVKLVFDIVLTTFWWTPFDLACVVGLKRGGGDGRRVEWDRGSTPLARVFRLPYPFPIYACNACWFDSTKHIIRGWQLRAKHCHVNYTSRILWSLTAQIKQKSPESCQNGQLLTSLFREGIFIYTTVLVTKKTNPFQSGEKFEEINQAVNFHTIDF